MLDARYGPLETFARDTLDEYASIIDPAEEAGGGIIDAAELNPPAAVYWADPPIWWTRLLWRSLTRQPSSSGQTPSPRRCESSLLTNSAYRATTSTSSRRSAGARMSSMMLSGRLAAGYRRQPRRRVTAQCFRTTGLATTGLSMGRRP
jgi:hypothetical protein